MTSDANGVYRGVYTYGEERISVRDLVEVEGVPNDPLYYMYDGRGSVTQLTNAVGNVRDKYRYTPFGEPMEGGQLSPNTKLLNNPYGYNGEYHDLESGFQYLRARYYNPETARFITRDSYLGEINEPLSLNRYAYTSNNPVMNVDPSGNVPESSSDDINLNNQIKKDYLREKSNSPVKNQPYLTLGSRGDSVVKVQKILDEQGYYLGSSGVDGVYGYYTNKAIKSYQAANGLQSDGIVGPETWGSFNGYVNKKASESKDRSKNSKDCSGIDAISSAAKYSDDLSLQLERYSYIKDPAMRVYNAWNATSPEERLQILKIDSRAYAGEQFVSRLSYLQYRKGIDVTRLSLNELDKIYEEVHYTRVATTMDYLNISSVIAEGSEKVGKGISELLKKTKGTAEVRWKSTDLLDELASSGVKYNPDNVLAVTKTADGKLVWLETGNSKAGMQHILDHANDFANKGIKQNQIQDLIMESLTNGKIVGYQGKGTGRPIYEVIFNKNKYTTAITVSDNGFIVGANPTTLK